MRLNIQQRIQWLVFITLLGVVSCRSENKDVPIVDVPLENKSMVALTGTQFHTADIKLGKIERRILSDVLKVNGTLDVPPQNLVSISAPFGGFLKSTNLLQGQYVKKGESLAVIQNVEYIQLQQDYLDTKSQLAFLELEYNRQLELAKENVNAQKSLQQAKASYFSKQASFNGLRAKLELLHINFTSLEQGKISSTVTLYSPIHGYVTEVNFNIGSFVDPTDVLFKIVDTNHLHAELTVFERDVVKLKKGQKVRFNLAGDSKERTATVYLIGREILSDRTIRVHCHLDNEDVNLLPGMYLSAVIELGSSTVNALPAKAIVEFEGNQYVFIPQEIEQQKESEKTNPGNRSFKMIQVNKGRTTLGYTEVDLPQEFNTEATDVVINGAYSLLSKIKNVE